MVPLCASSPTCEIAQPRGTFRVDPRDGSDACKDRIIVKICKLALAAAHASAGRV